MKVSIFAIKNGKLYEPSACYLQNSVASTDTLKMVSYMRRHSALRAVEHEIDLPDNREPRTGGENFFHQHLFLQVNDGLRTPSIPKQNYVVCHFLKSGR